MKITPQKNATDLKKDEHLKCQIGKKNATDLKKDEHPKCQIGKKSYRFEKRLTP